MKTIAIISHEYPPFLLSGVGNTTRHLVEKLCVEGFRVKVFTLKFGKYKYLPDFESNGNLTVHRIKVPFYVHNILGIFSGLFTWMNRGLLEDVDIIHSMDTRDAPFIYRPANVPFIVNCNDYWLTVASGNYFKFISDWKCSDANVRYLFSLLSKPIEYVSVKRATLLIPNTQYTKKRLCDHYHIPEASVRVVYKGIDATEYDKEFPKEYDFFFIGGNIELKGGEQLIDALLILKERGIQAKTLMVGRGDEKFIASLLNKISSSGLKDQVSYKSEIDHKLISEYYLSSKIFVIPTHFDSMPQVLYEAMAARLPVVASNVGGIPELVADGETGFLVPPFDHVALAEKMRVLLEDEGLRRSMGAKGRSRVLNVFNSDRMFNDYLGIYKTALGEAVDLPYEGKGDSKEPRASARGIKD